MPDRPERLTVDALLADALAVLAGPAADDAAKLKLVAGQVRLAAEIRKLARTRRAMARTIRRGMAEAEGRRDG